MLVKKSQVSNGAWENKENFTFFVDFQSLVIYNTLMKQTTAIITPLRSEHEWDCHWGLCL
jgi:hypothetical protein